MTKAAIAIGLALLAVTWLTLKRDIRLQYGVIVPEQTPVQMTLIGKAGDERQIDAHETYKRLHRRGWDECIEDFKADRLTFDSEPNLKQQWGIHEDAERDGYQQCRSQIFRMTDDYGTILVRTFLPKP